EGDPVVVLKGLSIHYCQEGVREQVHSFVESELKTSIDLAAGSRNHVDRACPAINGSPDDLVTVLNKSTPKMLGNFAWRRDDPQEILGYHRGCLRFQYELDVFLVAGRSGKEGQQFRGVVLADILAACAEMCVFAGWTCRRRLT